MLLDDNSDLLAWLHTRNGVCLFFSSLLCVQWDDTICLSDFCNLKCYLWMLRFVLFSIVMKRGEKRNVHEVVGCVVRPMYRFSLLVPFACVSLLFFSTRKIGNIGYNWLSKFNRNDKWMICQHRQKTHLHTNTHPRQQRRTQRTRIWVDIDH